MFDAGKITLPGEDAGGGKSGGLDIMKKPLGKKPPMGDMGGELGGGGDLTSALKSAGFPTVTPEQVAQIEAILGGPGKAGSPMEGPAEGEPPMGGGGMGGLPV
jgi:hypothetical protein